MPVLVLDTATGSTLVGIAKDGRVLAERFERDARAGAHRILIAVADVLREAGAERTELAGAIVGVGPGSFTGLRIGIATALGLSHGLAIPVTGVSSLAALLEGAPDGVAAIDARRGELFVAGPGEGVRTVGVPELVASLPPGTRVIGDGALRYRIPLEAAGLDVPPPADPRHRASTAAYVALARFDGAPVLPLYARPPDASPSLPVGGSA